MADENPSEIPAAGSSPKKETVRITLPPKPEATPMAKRETVRITAPGIAPKKETARIGATPIPAAPGAPMSAGPATRPLIPPPRPPSAPSVPSAAGAPPKPVAPPVAPAAAPKPTVETRPLSVKAAPKKETARIQVPGAATRVVGQPTVRMTQTIPLSAAPAGGPSASLRTASAPAEAASGSDSVATILGWVAVVAALAAGALGYMAYTA